MIIDFHMHCGKDIDKNSCCLDDIKSAMDAHNITHAVAFSFNEPNLIGKSKQILKDSIAHQNIFPFVRFNPNTITQEELHDVLQHGFKGIKLHPRSQDFHPNDSKHYWIFEECQRHKIPIIIHSRNNPQEPHSHPRKTMELATCFPKINFVLGHFCGADLSVFSDLADLKNVYTETSVCAIHYYIEKVYNEHDFDRILYGSDFPYSLPEVELPKVLRANIPEVVREKILWKNALDVLNLDFQS
jgi:uncharacterized protein